VGSIGKKWFCLAIVSCGFVLLFASSFSASVDRTSLSIHEQLELTLQVVETDKKLPEPTLTGLNGFKIIGKSHYTSTSYRLVNGKSSKSKTISYKFSLMPTKVGALVIPAQKVVAGATIYTSKPISITVSKNPKKATKSQNSPLYIKTNLNKKSVYVGEKVLLSYFIYTRYNVSGLRKVSDPKFDGFWSKQTFAAKQVNFTQNIVNGVIYGKMHIASYQLSPQKAGKLNITPMVLTASVRVDGDDFFSFGRTKDYRLVSQAQKLLVKELPSGPADFAGSIGDFKVSSSVSSAVVDVGDAITYTIKVSGNGNFVDDFPKFAKNDNYRFATPEITNKEGLNQAKYMVIAKKAGNFTIPATTFWVFSPRSGKYKKLTTKKIRITVKKNKEGFAQYSSGNNAQTVKKSGEDIDFIITDPKLGQDIVWVEDYRYWVLCLSVVLASLTFAKMLKGKRAKNFDQDYLKRKSSEQVFKKYIKDAASLAGAGDPEFYPAAHQGLMHFLCDTLALDKSVTSLEVYGLLEAKSVDAGLISQVKALNTKFEQARFMPGAMMNIREDYKKLKSLLKKLGKI